MKTLVKPLANSQSEITESVEGYCDGHCVGYCHSKCGSHCVTVGDAEMDDLLF